MRLALLLVAIRAIVGFTSGSARVYLAQEIAIDVLLGSAVLASLRTRRPFASWFAEDVYPFPEEMRESQTFTQAMRTVTLVWGAYFFARGLVRVAALLVTTRLIVVEGSSLARERLNEPMVGVLLVRRLNWVLLTAPS